jgi:hypothetical protein
MVITALGGVLGSVVLLIVVAGIIELVHQKADMALLPIGVRVAGSWVAAISALLGALLFRNLA